MTHTREELEEMIRKMQRVVHDFYFQAIQTGCHPFIEWCGLMGEYVKMCKASLDAGIDFTETTIHGAGRPMAAQPFHAAYFAEKFSCIFGTTFSQPGLKEAFMAEMFPAPEETHGAE
jgi:hypothetical protein